MSYVQKQKTRNVSSMANTESAALMDKLLDTSTFDANDPTVACYNRRSRILMDANKAEWWVAIAVLLLIAGIGFVAL
jgi:hypothetical protein